jgi:hypothetical protein
LAAELIQVYAAREGHPIRPMKRPCASMKHKAASRGKKREAAGNLVSRRPRAPRIGRRAGVCDRINRQRRRAAGSKLLMLAAGVAVGKFLLGSGGKGGRKLAVGALVEPGYVTRKKHFENKEYVLRFRPPRFVARAADQVQRGYKTVKNRISEYIEK